MTKELLAERLNGREYGDEITQKECEEAQAAGLLVVFGYSDDNAEFRGAFRDESTCDHGISIFLHRSGLLGEHEESCECDFCGYEATKAKCAEIIPIWGEEGYSWTYKTNIPHACFDIMEEGEKYCRGIIIDTKDLPSL